MRKTSQIRIQQPYIDENIDGQKMKTVKDSKFYDRKKSMKSAINKSSSLEKKKLKEKRQSMISSETRVKEF